MDAALFLEEFGNNPEDDGLILVSQLHEAQKHRVGFAFWTWKEKGGGSWGVFAPDGSCIRADRERLLARVYPRLTSDPDPFFHYDPGDGRFTMHAMGKAGDPSTVVYVPPEVTGTVTGDGAATVVVSADEGDGSRLAFVTPTGGAFTIAVAPAPLRLAGCGG